MPETEDMTANFLAEEAKENEQLSTESLPTEPEKPVEEKPEEPSPVEPKKEPGTEPEPSKEEEGVLSEEDLAAVYKAYGGDAVEELPSYQPSAPAPAYQPPPQQQQVPEIPQDVLNISPQQFMPEGQEFDPMEIYTPNTPSNMAALRTAAEQTRLLNVHERERVEQEQMVRQNMAAMDNLEARMEREKWPKPLREKFWKNSTGNPLVLNMLADGFLIEERRAMYKAQKTWPSGRNGESPAPVNKASKVIETPKSPDEIKKTVDEMLGQPEIL